MRAADVSAASCHIGPAWPVLAQGGAAQPPWPLCDGAPDTRPVYALPTLTAPSPLRAAAADAAAAAAIRASHAPNTCSPSRTLGPSVTFSWVCVATFLGAMLPAGSVASQPAPSLGGCFQRSHGCSTACVIFHIRVYVCSCCAWSTTAAPSAVCTASLQLLQQLVSLHEHPGNIQSA